MFTSKANLWRMLITSCIGVFAQWSGNGLTGYYLVQILDSIGITSILRQNQLNLSKEVWSLITSVAGAFLAKVLRRRTQFLLSFGGMTLVFAALTGCSAAFALSGSHSGAIGTVAFLFVFSIFYNLQHPLSYVYITEIFPFISRSKGVATNQLLSRTASAFNQYVNPIALNKLAWKFYLVYIGWLIVEVLTVYFVYPETKGPTLEEVAFVFEGKDAKVGLAQLDTDKHLATVDQVETV
jgi:MFS family permease